MLKVGLTGTQVTVFVYDAVGKLVFLETPLLFLMTSPAILTAA